jgi:hypothetical protein
MSSITGSCGSSQHELLIQQGLQQAQAAHIQQRQELQQQTVDGFSASPGQSVAEPNKGINIDLYA